MQHDGNQNQRPYTNNSYTKKEKTPRSKKGISLKHTYYRQLGHNNTSEDEYFFFAKYMLCQKAPTHIPKEEIKKNARKYLKNIRKRQYEIKQRDKLGKHIKSIIQDNPDKNIDITTLITSLKLLQPVEFTQSDNNSKFDSDES